MFWNKEEDSGKLVEFNVQPHVNNTLEEAMEMSHPVVKLIETQDYTKGIVYTPAKVKSIDDWSYKRMPRSYILSEDLFDMYKGISGNPNPQRRKMSDQPQDYNILKLYQ